jgi:hypothetical protein
LNNAIVDFKEGAARIIVINEKRIAEFKLEIARENAKNKATFL